MTLVTIEAVIRLADGTLVTHETRKHGGWRRSALVGLQGARIVSYREVRRAA